MKAKLKDTGEVVNIINLYDDGTAETEYHSYIKVSKLIFDFDDNDSDMPSEKRMRYELAKAAVQGLSSKQRELTIDIAIDAVIVSDEVIKRLKKKSEEIG